jgi:hypothetical protein
MGAVPLSRRNYRFPGLQRFDFLLDLKKYRLVSLGTVVHSWNSHILSSFPGIPIPSERMIESPATSGRDFG